MESIYHQPNEADFVKSGWRYKCQTDSPTCSGKAIFVNRTSSTWSFAYYRHGGESHSNFVLSPGEHHTVDAEYRDKYSVVAGNQPPPRQPRAFVKVYEWVNER